MRNDRLYGWIVFVLPALAGCAGPKPTEPAGIDTQFLRDFAETRGYSCGQPTGFALTPNGDAMLFLRSGPRDVVRNLFEISTADGLMKIRATADDLLGGKEEVLTVEEKARRERQRVTARGLASFSLSEDGKLILTSLSGELYVIQRNDGKILTLPDDPAGTPIDPKFSPDGRFVSCVRGHDLYVIELATMTQRRLTEGGTADVSHGLAEFVAQEEMGRPSGYWWSGDSQWIAFEEADVREVETLYIADARNPEQSPQGWRYPRAGTSNAKVRLGIVSVTGGEPRWVACDWNTYPYLATVHWGKDSPLTMYVQTRDQRTSQLLMVDEATGRTTTLLTETDDAWINIDSDMPRWLPGGEQFLWTSERSGEWELELRRRDGSVVKTYRPGSAKLYGVVSVDGARREVVVSGSVDPTQTHLYRIALDGGEVVALTREPGSHSGKFSRDGNVWVHTASLADGTISHFVRGRDATLRGELPSGAEQPPFVPKPELTTVETNGRTYYASILRPRGFDKSRKYPVINYVYGGPHSNMVHASARGYLRQQWIADQGFIMVSIDGRGTERRGREWERAIAGNVIDGPLADQADAMLALGEKYREMDLSRVGIYGWSFGGYFSTMAVLKRPDVFHAAVAGAPVIDWVDYDTHYTERYMGTPKDNATGYEACSALTFAGDLRRPLLLIHGTTDDNVYFTHTLKMAEALFLAGREYDLLALAGFTHMVPDPNVNVRLYERIVRYFRKHLVETTPQPVAVDSER